MTQNTQPLDLAKGTVDVAAELSENVESNVKEMQAGIVQLARIRHE